MSDETTPDAPAADGAPAPEATPTPAPEAEVTPQPDAQEADGISREEARKLRSEAAALRKRAKDAEAELASRREAEMTEAEKAAKRAEQAEQAARDTAERLRQANLKAEVAINATKHGVDPALATKLIREDVEFDDDGEPTNVSKLLADLVKSHPQLAAKPSVEAGSPANPGNPAGNPPETDVDRLRRLHNRVGNDPTRNPEAFGGGVIYHGTTPLA